MRHKARTSHLQVLSVRELHRRRRRAARLLTDPEATLHGTLVTQGRRCGKAQCRCTQGELHGPYVYVALARARGGSRLLYVPEELRDLVQQKIATTERIAAALEAISEINLELLARRALK
jgi:transposase